MKNGWCIGNYGELVHYLNNKLHNEKGPARIYDNGTKHWYQNDERHRLDGPASEYSWRKEWWYQGKRIYYQSQTEFERYLRLKLFW